MLTGKVKFFTESWGFITSQEDGKDYYCHISAILRSGLTTKLVKNEKVEFTVVEDFKTGRIKVDMVRLIISKGLTMTETVEVARHTGEVKFFKASVGWGFVIPDDGTQDVFVHITSLERSNLDSLVAGERVSYELVEDAKTKKLKAENIKLIA